MRAKDDLRALNESLAQILECESDDLKALTAAGGLDPAVDFRGAVLHGLDLSYMDLTGFDLSGADLRKAKISFANLSGVNLSSVNLEGADLSSAKLEGANLQNASLYGAILTNADLTDAKLEEEQRESFNVEAAERERIPDRSEPEINVGLYRRPIPLASTEPEVNDDRLLDVMLKLEGTIGRFDERTKNLGEQIGRLEGSITGLRTEMQNMRTELTTEMRGLRDDISKLNDKLPSKGFILALFAIALPAVIALTQMYFSFVAPPSQPAASNKATP
jgi:hypothetical protein